jgi:hypothetical protein
MIIKDHLVIRAETAKRCKAREVFMNSHITKVFKGFIGFKRERGESLDPQAPLFVSKKKGRIGQRTIQDILRSGLLNQV